MSEVLQHFDTNQDDTIQSDEFLEGMEEGKMTKDVRSQLDTYFGDLETTEKNEIIAKVLVAVSTTLQSQEDKNIGERWKNIKWDGHPENISEDRLAKDRQIFGLVGLYDILEENGGNGSFERVQKLLQDEEWIDTFIGIEKTNEGNESGKGEDEKKSDKPKAGEPNGENEQNNDKSGSPAKKNSTQGKEASSGNKEEKNTNENLNEEMYKKISALQQEKDDLVTTITNRKIDIEKYEEIEEIEGFENLKDNKILEAEEDIIAYQESIDIIDEKITSLHDSLGLPQQNTSIDARETQIDAREEEIIQLDSEISTLQKNISILSSDTDDGDDTAIQELQASVEVKEYEKQLLQRKISFVEESIEEIDNTESVSETTEETTEEVAENENPTKNNSEDAANQNEQTEQIEQPLFNIAPHNYLGINYATINQGTNELMQTKRDRDALHNYETTLHEAINPNEYTYLRAAGELLGTKEHIAGFDGVERSPSIFDENLNDDQKIGIVKDTQKLLKTYGSTTADHVMENQEELTGTQENHFKAFHTVFTQHNIKGLDDDGALTYRNELEKTIQSNGLAEKQRPLSVLETHGSPLYHGENLIDAKDQYEQLTNHDAERTYEQTQNMLDLILDTTYLFDVSDGPGDNDYILLTKQELQEYDTDEFIAVTDEKVGTKPVFRFKEKTDETIKQKIATPYDQGGIGLSISYLIQGLNSKNIRNIDESIYTTDDTKQLEHLMSVAAGEKKAPENVNPKAYNIYKDKNEDWTLDAVKDDTKLTAEEERELTEGTPDITIHGSVAEIATDASGKQLLMDNKKVHKIQYIADGKEENFYISNKKDFNTYVDALLPNSGEELNAINKTLEDSDEYKQIDDQELLHETVATTFDLDESFLQNLTVKQTAENTYTFTLDNPERPADSKPTQFSLTTAGEGSQIAKLTITPPYANLLSNTTSYPPIDSLKDALPEMKQDLAALDSAWIEYTSDTSTRSSLKNAVTKVNEEMGRRNIGNKFIYDTAQKDKITQKQKEVEIKVKQHFESGKIVMNGLYEYRDDKEFNKAIKEADKMLPSIGEKIQEKLGDDGIDKLYAFMQDIMQNDADTAFKKLSPNGALSKSDERKEIAEVFDEYVTDAIRAFETLGKNLQDSKFDEYKKHLNNVINGLQEVAKSIQEENSNQEIATTP